VDALREEEDVECTWKRNGTDRGRRLANDMGEVTGKPCVKRTGNKNVYTSRFVRVILAQGPCYSSLHRSNFNG
jgi:hypothetical protein